jgi:hypothetical protein
MKDGREKKDDRGRTYERSAKAEAISTASFPNLRILGSSD